MGCRDYLAMHLRDGRSFRSWQLPGRGAVQINIMPCEAARNAWEARTIEELFSNRLQHHDGFPQVF